MLRHVRGVLRRRGLELTLVDHRPAESGAYAPIMLEDPNGGGLAVMSSELTAPEIALLESMLGEAALDVLAVVRRREEPVPEPAGKRARYAGILGASPSMQELYALIDSVAPSDSTVLIQGENGTGKELVARAIHQRSNRSGHRFVVTNCSAFNDNLLDSELFGHKRGAFTGAERLIACHATYRMMNWDGRGEQLAREMSELSGYPIEHDMGYPCPGSFGTKYGVLAGDAPTISEALLSPRIRQFTPDPDVATGDLDSLPAAVEALERKMIGAAMRRHNGNKTRAAEELKVSRRNLIRLVQKYELE